MPTITFTKKAFLKHIDGSPDDDTLQETISMIGTDLASYGEEISVEIFPNRPDLLSVQGLARAINHYLNPKKPVDNYHTTKPSQTVHVLESAKNIRPHTRCCIARGLSLDEESIKQVIDIQEKLHVTFGRNRKKVAIGIYPMEHIKFPITFGAEPPGDIVFQPLEMNKSMSAQQMLESHPAGKAYGHLLQGAQRYPVFRDANNEVLSVPPIINSHTTGRITQDTTEVFIECSGHEEAPLEEALTMIACALSDLGATIEQLHVAYPDKKIVSPILEKQTRTISKDYVAARAGIPQEVIQESLAKMGLHLEGNKLTIPCYRTDFIHDVDVVEDAVIGYGYNNIEPTIPEAYTTGALSEQTIIERAVRAVFNGAGLQEVKTYYLTSEGIPLENPSTERYTSLRTTLITALFEVLEKNTSRAYPQNIYEIGPVFRNDKTSKTLVAEDMKIGVLLCGEHADYTRARQLIDMLAHALGGTISVEEHDDERFIPGRCGKITGVVEGVIGESHPELITKHGVTMPVAAIEVSIE